MSEAQTVGPNMNDLRRYAGLNPDGDTATLELCMLAAKEWFKNAGVDEPTEESSLYNMGVYMLATHYYDNRGVMDNSRQMRGNDTLPYGVMSIMHQLRL